MKRIAVMTSGGDSAGMNAALRAVVRSAISEGLEVVGIERGFAGLVDGTWHPLDKSSVSGIIDRGGTVLRTFRCPEFQDKSLRDVAAQHWVGKGVDGIVVIGGDGSLRGAHCVDVEWDIATIGVPATIDNDIPGTDYSIGYATALDIAVDAVDKIRDTATSHGRIFVIEVMGRHAGILALATGLCTGAEEILIPEEPFDYDDVARRIEQGYDRGKQHAILIVAEGAARASDVVNQIRDRLSREVRMVVLGHIQRGGDPVAFDRILASRLGAAAVSQLLAGKRDVMVGVQASQVTITPLAGTPSNLRDVITEGMRLHELLR